MKFSWRVCFMVLGLVVFMVGNYVIFANIYGANEYGKKPIYENVKCYDRFSNEIIGQTCVKKSDMSDSDINQFMGGLFLFVIGLQVFVINYKNWRYEYD